MARYVLPAHPQAISIAAESQAAVLLIAIQADDGLMQASLGIQFGMWRERVIDPKRPVFFLKGRKDELLVRSRRTIFLDNQVAKRESIQIGTPNRFNCDQVIMSDAIGPRSVAIAVHIAIAVAIAISVVIPVSICSTIRCAIGRMRALCFHSFVISGRFITWGDW